MEKALDVEVPAAAVVSEPVPEVPAIDVTEAAERPPRRLGRTGKASTSAKRAAPKRRKPTPKAQAEQAKRSRDGSVGRETFAAVEALVLEGKTKAEAFKQVSGDTGRNVGTVSANYYRVARASGAVKPRKRRGKPAPSRATASRHTAAQRVRRPRSVRSDNAAGGVELIVGQLVASVQALTEAVKAQDAEVRQLRDRLDGVRGLRS